MKRSPGKGNVQHILEREKRQGSWPEASKRIREGGDAVREKERVWIILCLKQWVFWVLLEQNHFCTSESTYTEKNWAVHFYFLKNVHMPGLRALGLNCLWTTSDLVNKQSRFFL